MDHKDFHTLAVTQWWRGEDGNGRNLSLPCPFIVQVDGTAECPIGNMYIPFKNLEWCGTIAVGRFPKADLLKVERILRETYVHPCMLGWDCQNWVWSAMRSLRRTGHTIILLTLPALNEDMHALFEAWDAGDL